MQGFEFECYALIGALKVRCYLDSAKALTHYWEYLEGTSEGIDYPLSTVLDA